MRLFQAHEVHPDDEVDWTSPDVEDWPEEQRLREVRNNMIMEVLSNGQTVQYKSTGSSMYPQIWSGDTCMFEPVFSTSTINVNDVVFCRVRPKMFFYAHKVIRIETPAESARPWYIIGNNKGHENG